MAVDPSVAALFENTKNAFAYKSDRELRRAHWLFTVMSFSTLMNWGIRITPWAVRIGLPIKNLLRRYLFPQFVGGESLPETARVAELLAKFQVQVILDYGVEGGDTHEADFDRACEEFIKVIDYASSQKNIPFISVKVTGIARFALLEKLDQAMTNPAGTLMQRYQQALSTLSSQEVSEWQRVVGRLELIGEKAHAQQVGVFIDAEDSWIQDPVDMATMLLMKQYNQQRAVIFNTYQLYRHDRLRFLKECCEAALEHHFILGAKLVRGAYMEKERQRASELNYPSPIQQDKEHTDRDFNAAIAYCIDHLSDISLVVASHNEYSNVVTTRLMEEKKISRDHPHVHFSQLYGMSDHITFNLAKAGYRVSKYLPFGPLEEVIPYLMRRAQENTSVAGQTGRELLLIRKELRRRKQLKHS